MEIIPARYLNALNVQLYKWRWALVSFSEWHVYCVSCTANTTWLKSTIFRFTDPNEFVFWNHCSSVFRCSKPNRPKETKNTQTQSLFDASQAQPNQEWPCQNLSSAGLITDAIFCCVLIFGYLVYWNGKWGWMKVLQATLLSYQYQNLSRHHEWVLGINSN